MNEEMGYVSTVLTLMKINGRHFDVDLLCNWHLEVLVTIVILPFFL